MPRPCSGSTAFSQQRARRRSVAAPNDGPAGLLPRFRRGFRDGRRRGQLRGRRLQRRPPSRTRSRSRLEVKKQKRIPSVAVALVIEDLEIQSTVNMSIEAAKATMDLLEAIDQVGVLDCNGFGRLRGRRGISQRNVAHPDAACDRSRGAQVADAVARRTWATRRATTPTCWRPRAS